ncbi:hypothetical protein [Methylobacterium brachiatum]
MSNRKISWAAALRDVKADRAPRAEVRCEPIKAYSRGIDLCAWRGRSGRRYPFRVIPAGAVDASDLRGMVVLGVDANGAIVGAHGTAGLAAVADMIRAGGVKVHLHSLCETLEDRAAVAADLRPAADCSLVAAAQARGQAVAADLYGAR